MLTVEEIEEILEQECDGKCLDNEQERREVAEILYEHILDERRSDNDA